jgi:hypothetical protein
VWKLQVKIVSIQVILPQVAQMKTCRKFVKLSTRTNKAPFQLQVRPLVRNMPAHSTGRSEHVSGVCRVSVSVTHSAGAAARVCVPGIVG